MIDDSILNTLSGMQLYSHYFCYKITHVQMEGKVYLSLKVLNKHKVFLLTRITNKYQLVTVFVCIDITAITIAAIISNCFLSRLINSSGSYIFEIS